MACGGSERGWEGCCVLGEWVSVGERASLDDLGLFWERMVRVLCVGEWVSEGCIT